MLPPIAMLRIYLLTAHHPITSLMTRHKLLITNRLMNHLTSHLSSHLTNRRRSIRLTSHLKSRPINRLNLPLMTPSIIRLTTRLPSTRSLVRRRNQRTVPPHRTDLLLRTPHFPAPLLLHAFMTTTRETIGDLLLLIIILLREPVMSIILIIILFRGPEMILFLIVLRLTPTSFRLINA